MLRVATVFGVSSAVTLLAGVALEISGNELADRAGINGIVFGATVLALATALPEISSGIEAVRLGDHQLAIATYSAEMRFNYACSWWQISLRREPVLPTAGAANGWLAGLSLALTAVYLGGVIVRPSRPKRLGPDSILAILIYV